MKKVSRLPKPYGDCVRDAKEEAKDFIYAEHEYSPEGCYRSCFQNELVRECGCGDPRFPVLEGQSHCRAGNLEGRQCLERMIEMGFKSVTEGCVCRQPCDSAVYSVSFSISKWPAGASQFRDCGADKRKCVDRYKDHAAMIEVFYEQLNFENLKETEAYGKVNLLADFGGQLGLWMGFSVITCMEFVVLLWDLGFLCFRRRKERKAAKKAEELEDREEYLYTDFQENYNDMKDYGEFIDTGLRRKTSNL